MALYFFRADFCDTTVIDDVGEEFSTVEEARRHADIVARELSRNRSEAVTVVVLDKAGNVIPSASAAFQ